MPLTHIAGLLALTHKQTLLFSSSLLFNSIHLLLSIFKIQNQTYSTLFYSHSKNKRESVSTLFSCFISLNSLRYQNAAFYHFSFLFISTSFTEETKKYDFFFFLFVAFDAVMICFSCIYIVIVFVPFFFLFNFLFYFNEIFLA